MLPKPQRLNLKKTFKWVAAGRKTETLSLKLFYRAGNNPQALVGIATSKNYFKKSHQRNRAKRLASKAVEEVYPTLPNNLNLVIMPKAEILEKSSQEVSEELKNVQYIFNNY